MSEERFQPHVPILPRTGPTHMGFSSLYGLQAFYASYHNQQQYRVPAARPVKVESMVTRMDRGRGGLSMTLDRAERVADLMQYWRHCMC